MEISLDSDVKLLALSARSYHALEARGVEKIRDLLKYDSLQKLLEIRNIGKASAFEILHTIRRLKAANEELSLFKKEPLISLSELRDCPIFSNEILPNATVVLNPKLEEHKIESLRLSPRCMRCLKSENIENLSRLLNTYPQQLLRHNNFGLRSLKELQTRLFNFLKWNMDEYLSFSAFTRTVEKNEVVRPKTLRRLIRERKKRQKALEVKKLYDTLGTYEAVARALGITRERVRQILEDATEREWLFHETKHDQRRKFLTDQLPKGKFVTELLAHGSIQKLAKRLGMKADNIKELANQYNVDVSELRERYLRREVLRLYREMVNVLGYHPAATVMQRNKKWHSLNSRICRIWGSMNNFRREFGLPIPRLGNPHFVEDVAHARLERKRRAEQRKEERKECIVNMAKTFGYVQTKIIRTRIGIKNATLYPLLNELISENKLARERSGIKTCYRLPNDSLY